MSGEHHDSWVKSVFGVDPGAYIDAAADKVKGVGADIAAGAKAVGRDIAEGAVTVEHGVVAGAHAVGNLAAKGIKAVEDGAISGAHEVVKGAKAVEHGLEQGVKAVGESIVGAETEKYNEAMKTLDAAIKKVADEGLNASHYKAQADSIRDEYADALKLGGEIARVAAVGKLVLRARQAAAEAKADVAAVAKAAVEGVGKAVTDMRRGAKDAIDKLPLTNKDYPELSKRLAELDTSIAEAGKVTDRAAHAKRLKQINVAAESLFDDAAAAAKDDYAIQDVYLHALQDRYGFTVTNPAGMKNTHFDQVFKMFDKVPETDIVQGKLKTLTYQPLNDKGGKNSGAAYDKAVIEMGDYGAEDWPYLDPKTGKDAPANGFGISTLHELGHSVDDRFKIMAANQGKPGAGGWRPESMKSVAAAFVGQFKAGPGQSVKIDDKHLETLVEGALAGKGADWPEGMSGDDWAMLKFMLDICTARRSDCATWPWTDPHDIGGRTYHEAYKNVWWSYDTAARKKSNTVRDYQWRAPGEWFAELYAFSYFKSDTPPSEVDSAVAAYMYGGKASSATAPAAMHS